MKDKLPIRFPDDAVQKNRAARRFRQLSSDERFAAILDLIASGEEMLASSPNRDVARRLREARERKWQQIQKELFNKHATVSDTAS